MGSKQYTSTLAVVQEMSFGVAVDRGFQQQQQLYIFIFFYYKKKTTPHVVRTVVYAYVIICHISYHYRLQ